MMTQNHEPTAGEAIAPDEVLAAGDGDEQGQFNEAIEKPAKIMRIGSMIKSLLDEVHQAPMDEAGRKRLTEIYHTSIEELSNGLSPDLAEELKKMAPPFTSAIPSEAELRVAQAQLVGWLEGLFHGIQASLMAQQMAARAQLDEMRERGLPQGQQSGETTRTGAYL